MLKAEHAEVNKLFQQAEETTERAVKTRESVGADLYEALMLHAKAEQWSLYNRLLNEEKLRVLLLRPKKSTMRRKRRRSFFLQPRNIFLKRRQMS